MHRLQHRLLAGLFLFLHVASCQSVRLGDPPSRESRRIYFGLFTERSAQEIEALIGKQPSILQIGICWDEPDAPFPTAQVEDVRRRGAIPEITWSPLTFALAIQPGYDKADQPKFQLRKIIAGDFDDYVRGFARDAKRWGHPFFLRFAHEMNGDWYPWSETVNGNGRGEYVRMWRHVHEVFEREYPQGATWVWAPDAGGQSYQPPVDFTELYPGDAYVDWVGLSAYNVEVARYADCPWEELEGLVASALTKAERMAPQKPLMISETGCVEARGNKARWIRNLLTTLKKFPQIKACCYFDMDAAEQGGFPDTRIDTSAEATRAFREVVACPYLASDEFGALPAGRILPLP